MAAQKGHLEVCQFLLDKEANVNQEDIVSIVFVLVLSVETITGYTTVLLLMQPYSAIS
jgi:hypothetical protein